MISAEEILHTNYRERIKGIESICTERFPQTLKKCVDDSMHQYTQEVLMEAAKNANLKIGISGESLTVGINLDTNDENDKRILDMIEKFKELSN